MVAKGMGRGPGGGCWGFFIRWRECSKIDSTTVNIRKAMSGTLWAIGLCAVCELYLSHVVFMLASALQTELLVFFRVNWFPSRGPSPHVGEPT